MYHLTPLRWQLYTASDKQLVDMAQLAADVPAVVSATPGRARPALVLIDFVYNVALGSNMDGEQLRC